MLTSVGCLKCSEGVQRRRAAKACRAAVEAETRSACCDLCAPSATLELYLYCLRLIERRCDPLCALPQRRRLPDSMLDSNLRPESKVASLRPR